MTYDEIDLMIRTLQDHTALNRLGHGEAHTIFAKLAELGYTIAAPAKTVAS